MYTNKLVQISSSEYIDLKKEKKKQINSSKRVGVTFENKFWLMMDTLIPKVISKAPFQIKLKSGRMYEIDVLAEFDEAVICIECKEGAKHDIKADLRRISDERKSIQSAVEKFLGESKTVVLLLAYEQQVPSQQDYTDAVEKKIVIWDQRHIAFYGDLISSLKETSKEIVFSDLLRNQELKKTGFKSRGIVVPALKSSYNGTPCYSMMISPSVLKKLCYVNRRGLQYSVENSEHYQRLIKISKIKQIKKYIVEGGAFPTTVLINFHKNQLVENHDVSSGTNIFVTLPDNYGAAMVIDGQHRIFGYSGLEKESDAHFLSVTAFNGLSTSEQAQMFVDINEKQSSVDSAVMCDLYTEIYSPADFNYWVAETIKQLNRVTPLQDKIYIPSVSGKSRSKYNIFINNTAVLIKKLHPLFKEVCNEEGEVFSNLIKSFVQTLADDDLISSDISHEDTFMGSNNGLYIVLKTLVHFVAFVSPDYPNIAKQSFAIKNRRIKEFASLVIKGIHAVGIDVLRNEKKNSSESAKDKVTKKIIAEAATHNQRLREISKEIFLESVQEDLNNEFKETLFTGRDGASDSEYFEEAILGTINAYINSGLNGNLWVGINDLGGRVGIDKEYIEKFDKNFDRLQQHLFNQFTDKLIVKGSFNVLKDISIVKYSESPLLLLIEVVAKNKKSVSVIDMPRGVVGYLKQSGRKTKIKIKNIEHEFPEKELSNAFISLYAELMQERGIRK